MICVIPLFYHVRALAHIHASVRMHIYNNVYTKNRHVKTFINVKYLLKKQLFYEKIWWNEK